MIDFDDSDDFDPEEDMARLEHYQLYGNRPRLMPDLSNMGEDFYGRVQRGSEGFLERNFVGG